MKKSQFLGLSSSLGHFLTAINLKSKVLFLDRQESPKEIRASHDQASSLHNLLLSSM